MVVFLGNGYRFRDDFVEKSSYWRWRIDNFASIEVKNGVLEMCMGSTEPLYYSNVKVSDGEFDNVPWVQGVLEVRTRFTSFHFGSAGFRIIVLELILVFLHSLYT